MNLHIVMFSNLSLSSGGCESWLMKFLLNYDAIDSLYETIHVYAFCDGMNTKNRVSGVVIDNRVVFHYLNIAQTNSLLRLIMFHIKGFIELSKHVKPYDTIMSIGSFNELALIVSIRKKHVTKIVWLRTLLDKHLMTRRSAAIIDIVRKIEKRNMKKCDLIIANGDDTKEYYANKYGFTDIITIPNAVIVSQVKNNPHVLCNKPLQIGFVARLEVGRGVQDFLDSIAIYNSMYKEKIVFNIIGDGSYADKVRECANKYDNVIYHGAVPNQKIYDFLSTFDVTLHLCLSSAQAGGGGVSNSLIESMFADNLIICWDSQIYRQVLTDDSCFFVRENDSKGLADTYFYINEYVEIAKKKMEAMKQYRGTYDFKTHMSLFCSNVLAMNKER